MSYQSPRHLLGQSGMPGSYSTEAQDAPHTFIMRKPATQLLTLNSADRFQNTTTANTRTSVINPTTKKYERSGATQSVYKQPWNNFILQRPQNLMEAFATRISVTEVRFPWYIPNINTYNNTIWLVCEDTSTGNPLNIYPVKIPDGFYTLQAMVTAINTALAGLSTFVPPPVAVPTFAVVGNNQVKVSPFPGSGGQFNFYWFDPYVNTTAPSENQYLNSASLAKTLGFSFSQVSGEGTNNTQPLLGSPTEGLYTQYVDIVSEKLNYYSQTKDGSSASSTNKALICRLYYADEVSITQMSPIGTAPFVIHRQFKTPKEIMWNKQAVIDSLDVSVLDQYGQLVPLPTIKQPQGGLNRSTEGAWPDFQISLLASEN